jgi:hypothetical protein
MENAPVITVTGISHYPGADSELWERFTKWDDEVYGPTNLRTVGATEYDRYQIIKESPDYPERCMIYHFENLKAREDNVKNPEKIAISEDVSTWSKRGVREVIWSVHYELLKGFRREPGLKGNKEATKIENAPITNLEGFRLSPEEQEKYDEWLTNFGYSFISLFIKLPGLKGYDFYKYNNG